MHRKCFRLEAWGNWPDLNYILRIFVSHTHRHADTQRARLNCLALPNKTWTECISRKHLVVTIIIIIITIIIIIIIISVFYFLLTCFLTKLPDGLLTLNTVLNI